MAAPLGPGVHPPPPLSLRDIELPLAMLAAPVFRVHRTDLGAIHFGSTGDNRFDAPNAEYGVLYVALDLEGAFIEGLIRDVGAGQVSRLVSMSFLESRGVARLTFPRELKLVNLTGANLAQIGADMRLCCGEAYAVAQEWALEIWHNQNGYDGILFPSRHDGSRQCAAIFDRAPMPQENPLGAFTDDRPLLARLLNLYGVGIA